MNATPVVAIIGRPNVGKSTLFNRLAGRRISIVENTPGVTRDRIFATVEWRGRTITLIDTGGLDLEAEDIIFSQMRHQAELAVSAADVIIFLVDGKSDITRDDYEVAHYLRASNKPVVLAVNKIDNYELEQQVYEFYALGLDEPISLSAEHGRGTGDLLDAVMAKIPEGEDKAEEGGGLKIAVVGRPNVGKSSLVNCILKQERSIVSDIPGTTRDAIDTEFTHAGEKYTIIDTAGIRRKSRIENRSIERYGVIRALAAIRRCDVAIIVLDATQGIVEQDVKIAGFVDDEGKPSVIAVNKWDAIEKDTNTASAFEKEIDRQMPFASYAPKLFISAKTGQRVPKLFELIQYVYGQSRFRVQTGLLNEMLADAQASVPPPSEAGKQLKLLYATQAGISPPTFVIFVNDAELMHFSYQRFIENYIRKTFGLMGTPIRLIIRTRDRV